MATTEEWISAFAARLGVEPPGPQEIDTLLALAGIAAHASERTAAPISCWLTAKAALSPDSARQVALDLAAALGGVERGT